MRNVFAVCLLLWPAFAGSQPNVSTVTPASGSTAGGGFVHVHGKSLFPEAVLCGFANCFAYVKSGGAGGTWVDNTANEIVVIAPPHAAGVVDLEVNIPPAPSFTVPGGYRYVEAQPTDLVRLLVPIAVSANGALGTSWRTEFVVHNGNATSVTVSGGATPPSGTAPVIAPSTTTSIALYPPPGNFGAFIYVPRELAPKFVTSLRVHDTTRDADSWGADVPIVSETAFRESVVLIGVPADSRYRTLLRVYAYNGYDTPVRVDLRDDASGELLGSVSALLQSGLPPAVPGTPPNAPAYAQIALDPVLTPIAAAHPRVRVEAISTLTPAPPLWAFVAITNNTTQQVTTITPGRLGSTEAR